MAKILGQLPFTGKVVGTTKANEHMPATTFSGKVTTSGGLDSPGNVTTSGTLLVKQATTLKGAVEAKGAVGVDGVLSAKNEVKGFVPFTLGDWEDYSRQSRSEPEYDWKYHDSAYVESFEFYDGGYRDGGNELVLVAEDKNGTVGTWRWKEKWQETHVDSTSHAVMMSMSASMSRPASGTIYGKIVLNGKRLFWNDREIVVGDGGVLKLA